MPSNRAGARVRSAQSVRWRVSLGCAHGARTAAGLCSSGKIVSNVVQSTQDRMIHWPIANVRAIRTLLRRGERETSQFLGIQLATKVSKDGCLADR